MRRISVLIIASLALLGLCTSASAKVEISGFLSLGASWAYESDAARGGDDLLSLYRLGAGESIIGITYISDDNKFEGVAELSLYGRSDGNIVETSLAKMVYSWDDYSIMMGLDNHPSDGHAPAQTLDDATALEGYGNSVLDTNEQIRFTYGDKYKFQISIDNPYKESVWDEGKTFNLLPGLTGAIQLNFGNVVIHPWAHLEYLNLKNGDADDSYYSLDMGLEISGDFGLVGFSAAVNYGINTAQNDPVISGDPLVINNMVEDNVTQLGVWGELKVGNLSLGAGYATASRDDWSGNPYTMAAFANYLIEFGIITFIPEIVWFNHGEDEIGADLGETFLFGLWTQMKF